MRAKNSLKQLKSLIKNFINDKEGSMLPIVAMAFPIIIGFAGLGADTGLWMSSKRNLQNAADAAVIAAGWELAQGTEDLMDNAAFREAVNNGYDSSANGELQLIIVNEDDDGVTLAVDIEQDAGTFFSQIVFNDPVRVAARSEALITDVDGRFCILALEEEDSDALTSFGSVEVNAPTCGIAVNSSDDEALTIGGNSDVTVSTVRISGDYDTNGSVDFVYESMKTGQSRLADPYEDLEVPEHDDCDQNNLRMNSGGTLSPGTYCGGLNISGNNDIEFEPGVYIIDGGNFKVTGSGELFGEGVTFILTGSGNDYAGLDISGSRVVDFSAPTTGEDWSGITFFQDRDAPQKDNLQNKIVGTSDIFFNGVAYFPSQGLWFGGDTTIIAGENPCTKLIARTVTLAGNPALGNNCEDYDVEDIGSPTVKLVR